MRINHVNKKDIYINISNMHIKKPHSFKYIYFKRFTMGFDHPCGFTILSFQYYLEVKYY